MALSKGAFASSVIFLLLWLVDLIVYFVRPPSHQCRSVIVPSSSSSSASDSSSSSSSSVSLSLPIFLVVSFPLTLFFLFTLLYFLHARNLELNHLVLQNKLLHQQHVSQRRSRMNGVQVVEPHSSGNTANSSDAWSELSPLPIYIRCVLHRCVMLPFSALLLLSVCVLSVASLYLLPLPSSSSSSPPDSSTPPDALTDDSCHRALASAAITTTLFLLLAVAFSAHTATLLYACCCGSSSTSSSSSSSIVPSGRTRTLKVKNKKGATASNSNVKYSVVVNNDANREDDEFELDEMNGDGVGGDDDENVVFDGEINDFDDLMMDDDDDIMDGPHIQFTVGRAGGVVELGQLNGATITTVSSSSSSSSSFASASTSSSSSSSSSALSNTTCVSPASFHKHRLAPPPSDLASSSSSSSLSSTSSVSTSSLSEAATAGTAADGTTLNETELVLEDDLEAWANQAIQLVDEVTNKQNNNSSRSNDVDAIPTSTNTGGADRVQVDPLDLFKLDIKN